LRRLRPNHLEALYNHMLLPTDGRKPLAPKTVLEVHLIIRGALADAVRNGLVSRNVALVAHAPKLRSIPKIEQRAWNAEQLQAFLQSAAGHRLFAAFWLAANTGVRRSELLGLQWNDLDLNAGTMSVNRGIVAVAYELHESRGKTRNSRRRIDLDPTTVAVLRGWNAWQQAECVAVAGTRPPWVFADPDGNPPHAISQAFERITARASIPIIRLHDLRHTHATLLIQAGVPVKVVSERLGHATPAFTINTYQHVLPGMQADAARIFERLVAPAASTNPGSTGSTRLKHR
jgi:integrase